MTYEATPARTGAIAAARDSEAFRAALRVLISTRAAVLLVAIFAALSFGPASGGLARENADKFDDPEETKAALDAGGGFEITFKKQITLRLDARNWSLFNQNHANNGQEYSGGLAIFF